MVDGLEAVFLANRSRITRFLRARGAGDEAEDLAQDLWLKVGGRSDGPIGDPVGYLYRMANNLMIDRHRSAVRRRSREDVAVSAAGGLAEPPTIEAALIARERLRAVDQAIAALGDRTATIFRRFRLDGIGQRDIAHEQGISLSAVEKHLRKAYQLLAELRDAADGEPADADAPRGQRLHSGGEPVDRG